MMNKRMMWVAGAMVALVVTTGRSDEAWRFQAGISWRGGMKVTAGGCSHAEHMPWERLGTQDGAVLWEAHGPYTRPGAFEGDQDFADGYMRASPFTPTGNTGLGVPPGMTWNWSYHNAAQHDPSAQTLTLSRQLEGELVGAWREGGKTRTIRSAQTLALGTDADARLAGWGGELGAAKTLLRHEGWRVSLAAAVAGFRPGTVRLNDVVYRSVLTETRQGIRVRDEGYTARGQVAESAVYADPYNVIGSVAPGHAGTYLEAGPIINYMPVATDMHVEQHPHAVAPGRVAETVLWSQQRQWHAASTARFALDVDHYALRIGPHLDVEIERFTLGLQPWASLNYFELDASRTETLRIIAPDGSVATRVWHDKSSDDTWRFGLGLRLAASYALTERLAGGLHAGYEWIAGKPKVDVGPGTLRADLSGLEAGVHLTLAF